MNSLEAVALTLRQARADARPCAPVRDRISGEDRIAAAYRVQRLNQDAAGPRAGVKVGYGTPTAWRPMGLDEPGFGALSADMIFASGDEVPRSRLIRPKVEAEVGLVLERDLAMESPTAADVLRATAFAVAAVEIVDVRIAEWDITPVDAIADNMGAGAMVLGGRPRPLRDIDLDDLAAEVRLDGSPAAGGAGLGWVAHPIGATVRAARWAVRQGQPLLAGDLVMAGALHLPVWLGEARRVEAAVKGVGRLAFTVDG